MNKIYSNCCTHVNNNQKLINNFYSYNTSIYINKKKSVKKIPIRTKKKFISNQKKKKINKITKTCVLVLQENMKYVV